MNQISDNSQLQVIAEKVEKWEIEVDSVAPTEPEKFENLLRRMRYTFHENHYLITDVKRRLIGNTFFLVLGQ